VYSVQDATAAQQQQQEQHQYQMMQFAGEREHDPDEVVADIERTVLDFFNSDLNLEISRDGLVLAKHVVLLLLTMCIITVVLSQSYVLQDYLTVSSHTITN